MKPTPKIGQVWRHSTAIATQDMQIVSMSDDGIHCARFRSTRPDGPIVRVLVAEILRSPAFTFLRDAALVDHPNFTKLDTPDKPDPTKGYAIPLNPVETPTRDIKLEHAMANGLADQLNKAQAIILKLEQDNSKLKTERDEALSDCEGRLTEINQLTIDRDHTCDLLQRAQKTVANLRGTRDESDNSQRLEREKYEEDARVATVRLDDAINCTSVLETARDVSGKDYKKLYEANEAVKAERDYCREQLTSERDHFQKQLTLSDEEAAKLERKIVKLKKKNKQLKKWAEA